MVAVAVAAAAVVVVVVVVGVVVVVVVVVVGGGGGGGALIRGWESKARRARGACASRDRANFCLGDHAELTF